MKTRRSFLQHSLSAAAAIAVADFLPVFGLETPADEPFTFDFHCHPGLFFAKGSAKYLGDEAVKKTITEMGTGHLKAAFFSLVGDAPLIEIGPDGVRPVRRYESGEGRKEYTRQMALLKEVLRSHSIPMALKAADLNKSDFKKSTAAFISLEGGDVMVGDYGLIETMYTDGVRSIQLVHYTPTALGDLQTAKPQFNGLSVAGKMIVKEMNKLGMVVDVAHASFDTVKDVVNITQSPIILSHSILKMNEERPISARAITVEHARLVASTGGVIGAWPSGFNKSFDEFVDNTFRLVDVVGIDHVGLGTDMDGNYKPVFGSYLQLTSWGDGLKAKGLKQEEVNKILGGNARRVLNEVLK